MSALRKALLLACLAAGAGDAAAANRFAVANTSWALGSTWSATSGGAGGAGVPTANDDVFIGETNTARAVTIPTGFAAVARSVTIGTTAGVQNDKSLTLATATSSLTVSQNLTVNKTSNNNTDALLNVNAGTVTVQGDLTLGGTSGTNSRTAQIVLTTGRLNIDGDLVFVAGTAGNNVIDYSGSTGTINLGGAFTATVGTIQNPGDGVFNYAGTTAQTVIINVSNIDYPNLRINNTSATGATLSASIANGNILGDLRVQSGILNNGGFAMVGGAGEVFELANGARLNLTGTSTGPTGFATFSFGPTSTTSYQGTTQAVAGLTYGHLILATSGAKTAANNMTVVGNFSILGTATFNSGTSRTHTFQGNWTVDTTAAAPFAFTTASIINFNAPTVAAQTSIGGTSTATLAFNDVNINNASGVALNENASFSGGATPTLTVAANATLTPAPGVIVSGTGTLTGNGTVQVTRIAATPSFNAQYTVTTKTLTNLTVEYIGTAAQEVANTQAYPRLEINNPNGVTLTGGNVTVSTLLTLTSGNITTGGNDLLVTASCVTGVTRTSGHVIGDLRKAIPAGASTCVFEVGSGADYAPVVMVFAAGTGAGNITARTTGIDHPSLGSSPIDDALSVNRYWTLTNNSVTLPAAGYTARFNYVNGQPVDYDPGATPANFFVERWDGTNWFPTTPNATCAPTPAANLCEQINGVTVFGDFAIGETLAGLTGQAGLFNGFDTTTPANAVLGFIQTKQAGVAFNVRLVRLIAARTALDTTYNQAGVTVELLDASDNSGTLNATTGCRPIGAAAGQWHVIAGSAQTVTFAAGLEASVTFTVNNSYRNVRLHIVRVGTGAGEGCSTDPFAIRPTSLTISAHDATWETAGTSRALANTGVAAGVVHKASEAAATTPRPFTLRALANPAAATNYDGAPTIVSGFPNCTGVPTAGTCTNPGALTYLPGSWTGTGTRENATANYAQAGVFRLQLEDAAYAAVDAVDGSSAATRTVPAAATASIGRFVPDRFVFSSPSAAQLRTFGATCAAARSFTYIGQRFWFVTLPSATVNAVNAAGNVTTNYTGSLFKLVVGGIAQTYSGNGVGPTFDSSLAPGPTLTSPGNGAATYAADNTVTPTAGAALTYTRALPVVPFTANISLTVTATDSAEAGANQGNITGSTLLDGGGPGIAFDQGSEFRYGIMKLGNAVGSETLNLPVPLEVQYWTAPGFVRNTADNCTALTTGAPPPNIALGGHQGNLDGTNMGNSHISLPGGTFAAGALALTLTPPLPAALGSVNVTINLAVPAENKTHLLTSQSGGGYTDNPVGRAAFGVFGSQPRNFIYFREVFN